MEKAQVFAEWTSMIDTLQIQDFLSLIYDNCCTDASPGFSELYTIIV